MMTLHGDHFCLDLRFSEIWARISAFQTDTEITSRWSRRVKGKSPGEGFSHLKRVRRFATFWDWFFCRRCCWFIILIQEDPCYSFAFSVDCRTGIEVDLMRSWGLLYLQNPVGVVRSAYACSWSGRAKPCQERSLGFLVPCSLASCLRLKSKKQT